MKRFILIAAALLFAGASTAQAQDIKPYAGLAFGAFGVEESEPGFNQKSTVFGGYGKLGLDFNEYIGAEVRIGATSSGSAGYPAGTLGSPVAFNVALSAQNFFSYLVKLQYPVAEDFRVYGLIGGTTAKFKLDVSVLGLTGTTSKTKTGFSYGGGGEYFVSDKISIGAEWVQYWTDVNLDPVSTARIWGASGSINYYF